jgi:hypothetical protein
MSDEAVSQWIRAAGQPLVWTAIDSVAWTSATKCRAKNAAQRFLNDNPHALPIHQMRHVGPAIMTVLRRAMANAEGAPARTAEPDPERLALEAVARAAEAAVDAYDGPNGEAGAMAELRSTVAALRESRR